MLYAQDRAIIKNKIVRLEFDNTFKKYWLTQQEALEGKRELLSDLKFQRIASSRGRIRRVPSGVRIQSKNQYLDFHPDGTVSNHCIYICRDKNCYTISSQEQKGFIHLYSYKKRRL